MKQKLLATTHTILILLAWASPFWLDWKIIFACLIFYYIQLFIFKGCILTNLQFNKKLKHSNNMTMYAFWAEKLGLKINRLTLKFWSKYIMPVIILIITIIWQILLNHRVFLRLW